MSQPTSSVPAYVRQGDDAQGAVDRIGVQIPMLYAVSSQTKNKDMKEDAGVGALVILEGDDAYTTILAPLAPPVACSVLKHFTSYATFRDQKDPREDKFWVKAETLDPQSEIAQKAVDRDRRTEEYPKALQTVKGRVMAYRHVEKLNYIVKITEGPAKDRVVMLTFSKGGWRYGKAFHNILARAGAVDTFAMRIGIHVDEKENQDKETWPQICGCLLDDAWHDEATYKALVADFATAETTFKGIAAQIGGAPAALPAKT